MADQVGIYILSVTNPELAAETAAKVDRVFKNSYAETLTETEKAFQLGFVALTEAILLVIQLVSFVVIVIIMAVAANSMSMSVRERLGEYAVFKTLGFGGTYLATMILGESLLIAVLGGAGGVLLTFRRQTPSKLPGRLLPRFFGDEADGFFSRFGSAGCRDGVCGIADLAGGQGPHYPSSRRVG